MTQQQIINHIHYIATSIRQLQKRKDKAETAEREYSPKKEAKSWAISELMEKEKDELRKYVNKLL